MNGEKIVEEKQTDADRIKKFQMQKINILTACKYQNTINNLLYFTLDYSYQ